MKKLLLIRYLVFELLIAGSMMGVLTGCGKKEYQQGRNASDRQCLSIGEELQWESCFDWLYFPKDESVNGGKIGYFKQMENNGKRIQTVKSAVYGAVSTWPDGDTIEVYHDMLSEEDFFALINSRSKELAEKYSGEEVAYRMNGSTEIDQFVQLDAGREHELYIRVKDSVYALYAEMDNKKWQDFLEEWLFTFELRWNGLMVMKESGTVSDTYAGCKMFQWGDDSMRIDGDVLLFHVEEDGVYFKTESDDEEESLVEEVVLHPIDLCLEYGSWEETVSYFKDRYPKMYSLEANLYGENTLWDFEKKALDQVFYRVEEPEGSHGFFLWNGEAWEVFSWGKTGYYNMVDTVRRSMNFDYHACFLWEQNEDESTMYADNLEGKYFYIKELGNGKVIRLRAKIIEEVEGELLDTITYGVEIFDEKGDELLQEIQVDSTYAHESPFEFEDFNADGYLDLTVTYYYGANGGSASHYIFSPSKKEFVKLDSELDYYGMYGVDYETRRLYMHYHGSAISGTEITYQWKNEMDYEMIKQFSHDSVEGGVQVKITRYEKGQEEILSDYLYLQEEYVERGDIWGTYYEDFIWEKEVTDRSTGKKYVIRYAEVFLPEEAGKNKGIYYDGRIYVYDEDTYLISVTHSEIISKSSSIIWEDGGVEKEQAVVIHYVDGGGSTFYLSGLIQPDYQFVG